jgi:hypothetical protein
MDDFLPIIQSSLKSVQSWVERHEYKGYEPFDGLSSWVRPLTFKNQFLERILMQVVRQSPLNLRPLLGIAHKESTKGRGYMARGYLIHYQSTGDRELLNQAVNCLDWLDRHKARKFMNHSWSNHFDFTSRGGLYTREDPIIVWTSLIGHAYIDAYEILGERRFLDIARSACRWILDLPREETSTGNCLSYYAMKQESIHNANLLGAAILARTYKYTGEKDFLEVARSAMAYSCSRQLLDGSWWYGEQPDRRWIDSFHTGYNLDSVKYYGESTGDWTYLPNLKKGLEFFKEHFFEPSGRPKYYCTRAYPIDIQCAAQAVDTLTFLAHEDSECLPLAMRVARWTIEHMQDGRGHFHYRHYPWGKAKTPMLHWGQATMFKALATLHAQIVPPKVHLDSVKQNTNGLK